MFMSGRLERKRMNNKIPAYFSMQIRGKAGDEATGLEMSANVLAAIEVARHLEEKIPELALYVPHKVEAFTSALLKDVCTVEDVLAYQAEIVKLCKVLIAATPYGISQGCDCEIDTALENGVKIITVDPNYDGFASGVRGMLRLWGLLDEHRYKGPVEYVPKRVRDKGGKFARKEPEQTRKVY